MFAFRWVTLFRDRSARGLGLTGALSLALGLLIACSDSEDKNEAEPVARQQQRVVTCNPTAPFDPPVPAFTGSTIADGLTFSQNGQTAYLSARSSPTTSYDLYVATRNSPAAAFDGLTSLGSIINTPHDDRAPSLSGDGQRLYMTRMGSGWANDIAVATLGPTGFGTPALLPSSASLNVSGAHDQDPFFLPGGPPTGDELYYASEATTNERNLYVAREVTNTGYGSVAALSVNSPSAEDYRPVLSADGLTLYFASTRPGIGGDTQGDIWTATRPNRETSPFGPATNLYAVNSSYIDLPVTRSNDGCTLYFASNRETGSLVHFRLYEATRASTTPALVTTVLNIVGPGSVTTSPFQCSTSCWAQGAPGTTMLVQASSSAHWSGSCAGHNGAESSDGVIVFTNGGVCTVTFPSPGYTPCDPATPFGSVSALFPSSVIADGFTLTHDELTAYVSSQGAASYDLYSATRQSKNAPFGSLQPLENANPAVDERAPWLSDNALRLYFWTASGNGDLMMASRPTPVGQFGPASAVPGVNTSSAEEDPFFLAGESRLFFSSDRVTGGRDLWTSVRIDGALTTPTTLAIVNTPVVAEGDRHPVLTADGLTLYFHSDRGGLDGDTGGDIWIAQRTASNLNFGPPTLVGGVNTSGREFPVALSRDACTLYLASNRDTGGGGTQTFRLYQTRRGGGTCAGAALDDGNPCTVDTCVGGNAVHEPAAAGTSCADANACNGAEVCNGTGACMPGTPPGCEGVACDTDNGCGVTCLCPVEGQCDDDADCSLPLRCGIGIGSRFGNEPGTNRCWLPECAWSGGRDNCGTFLSPCGLCSEEPRQCTNSSDCAENEACTPGNGILFGYPLVDVCWPAICTTEAREENCGSTSAPCGICTCEQDCEGKACGQDAPNGCGGQCAHICGDKEPGCQSDVHCPSGSLCFIGGGPRVGLSPYENVCLPAKCAVAGPAGLACGGMDSECGLCSPCASACTGRCGGVPDGCGGSCSGSCPTGQTCSSGGYCAGDYTATHAEIPDGLGGTRTVAPLPPTPTDPVGATAGTFGVTDTGKANYRIPIQVPPGRLGLQPALSLAYVGTRRNGALGVGWILEGLSTISRCSRTYDVSRYSAPPADDRSDRYCLDGDQLQVAYEATYGGDGSVHYPEFDPRTRVIPYGNDPTGPTYFQVWRPNGLIYTYGASPESTVFADVDMGVKREWALNRVEDHLGNYLTIDYANIGPAEDDTSLYNDRGTREILPTAIHYTGFDGPGGPALQANRTIAFHYSNLRSDWDILYGYGGHSAQRTWRLEAVTSDIGGNVSRRYELTYGDEVGQPARNRTSRLNSIAECDGFGVCKPPTRFDYYENDFPAFEPQIRTGIELPRGTREVGTDFVSVLETDGDGMDDILIQYLNGDVEWTEQIQPLTWVRYRRPKVQWQVLHGGSANDGMTLDPSPLGGFFAPVGWGCDMQPLSLLQIGGPLVVDWDLDGIDDFLDNYQYQRASLRLFPRPDGSPEPVGPMPILPVDCTQNTRVYMNFSLGDAAGDGIPDLLECDAYNDMLAIFPRGRLTPTLVGAPVSTPSYESADPNFPNFQCPQQIPDIDGDGRSEIAAIAYGSNEGSEETVDGTTWLKVLKYREQTGDAEWEMRDIDLHPVWADLNGDGLKDLVTGDTQYVMQLWAPDLATWTGGPAQILLSTGREFRRAFAGPMTLDEGQIFRAVVGDFNHDGREDLLVPNKGFSRSRGELNVWKILSLGPTGLEEIGSFDTELYEDLQTIGPGGFQAAGRVAGGDFDGDGNRDVVMVRGREIVLFRGRGAETGLLKTVTDGLGKRIEITYRAGALPLPPERDCGILECKTRTEPIVSTHSEGSSGFLLFSPPRYERRVFYEFQDGRTDPASQKFLGFGRRVITETDGLGEPTQFLRRTEIELDNSTYSYDRYPLAGKHRLIRVTEGKAYSPNLSPGFDGNRVTETTNEWTTRYGAAGVAPILEAREVRTYDLVQSPGFPVGTSEQRVISRVREEFTLDPTYNNVTNVVRTETINGQTQATTTIDIGYEQAYLDDWLISLPTSRTVRDEVVRPDSTVWETRTTSYQYYDNGLLKQAIREPNDAYYRLQRDLQRNAYGNVFQLDESSSTNTTSGPGSTRSTTVTYDVDQIFPTTTTSSGLTTYLEADPRHGSPILLADSNGIATQRAYDAFGRPTQQVGPDTASLTTYHPAADFVVDGIAVRASMRAVTNTVGYGVSEVASDSFGRQVRSIRTGLEGIPIASETEYDQAGRPWKRSLPHAAGGEFQGLTEYLYDSSSQLSLLKLPNGGQVEFQHASRASASLEALGLSSLPDHFVWFTRTKDPNGGVEISISNQRSELVASRDALGSVVNATPGPFATYSSVTSAGSTTGVVFDRIGRVASRSDPDRDVERYTYTAWSEVYDYFAGTSPSPSLHHEYDSIGRVTAITPGLSGGPLGPATFDYDNAGGPNELGRLVSMTSFDGSRRDFHYEPPTALVNRGFLKSVTDTVAGVAMTTEQSYNGFGAVETVTYPSNHTIQYQYDLGGKVSKIGSSGFVETYWELLESDQGLRPFRQSVGAMTTETQYHATTGKLRTIHTFPTAGGDAIQDLEHFYDSNGNLTRREDYLRSAANQTEIFIPDGSDRLREVTHATEPFSVVYDANGNINTISSAAGAFQYDNPGGKPAHAPRTSGDANFTYYDMGARKTASGAVAGGTQTTTYDPVNQPLRISFASGPNAFIEFAYQATGQRSQKRLANGTQTLYSGAYERRTSSTGDVEQIYRVYSPSGPVLEIAKDSAGDELSRAYLHTDLLGSPEVLTSGSGNVLHRQKFGPFGLVENPSWQSSNAAAQRVRRGYTGHEHDPETGLVNMGARFYDARIARFTAPDPFVQAPGWTQAYNRYSYGFNNPFSWTDPTGLQNEPEPEEWAPNVPELIITAGPSPTPPEPIELPSNDALADIATSPDAGPTTCFKDPPIMVRWETSQAPIFERPVDGPTISPWTPEPTGYAPGSDEDKIAQALFGPNLVVNAADVAADALEWSNVRPWDRHWRGKNGKYYRPDWGGNGATGGRSIAWGNAKTWGTVGKGMFYVSGVMSVVQLVDNVEKGNAQGAYKNGLDIGVGWLSMVAGPPGALGGAVYLGMDLLNAWEPIGVAPSIGPPPGAGGAPSPNQGPGGSEGLGIGLGVSF